MRSASSTPLESTSHLESRKAKRTGRHRAPSRVHRTIKIIGVTVPAAALLGTFGVFQAGAQTGPPDPVARTMADYHLRTLPSDQALAEGSATVTIKPPAKGPERAKRAPVKTSSAHRPKSAHRPSRSTQSGSSSAGNQGGPTPTPSPSSSGGSSAGPTSTVQQDIANGNNLLAVAQYLVKNGYSNAAAAGVAACVDGESGGNPESVGSGGGGLIGWTPLSSAAPSPNIITGNPAQDMMTQLADILYYNSTEIGQSWVTQLNGISDPVAAADFFSQNFEKPAVLYSDVVPSVAQQVFSQLGG